MIAQGWIEKISLSLFGSLPLPTGEISPRSMAFYVIPGKQGCPRWLIPADTRLGVNVLRKWEPCDPVSRLKWQALLLAYQLGQLQRLPGIEKIHISLTAEASSAQQQFVPVVYVGTPCNAMKLVVMQIDAQTAQPVQVRKIPMQPGAREKILDETAFITWLASEKPGLTPAILSLDREAGIADQQFVDSRPFGGSIESRHIDWLLQLRLNNRRVTLSEAVSTLRQRLISLGENRPDVREQLARAEALRDETLLPAVIIHGDFSPWNARQLPDGQLFMVDWEEAEPSGLPLYDLVHFHFIRPYAAGTPLPEPERFLANPHVCRYLKAIGLNRRTAEKIIGYYALNLWYKQQTLHSVEGIPTSLSKFIQKHWRYIA